jgi:hypothetical protein
MKVQLPKSLQILLNPKLAIPLLSVMALVALTGAVRAIFGGSWIVPIIVALGVALVGVVATLVVMLFRQERAQRRVRGMDDEKEVANRSASEAQSASRARIEDRFRAMLEELRKSRLGRDGIYALPWYLVVGEPGSGKSALLHESGLDLPAEFARLPAPGATRDCDFWLTNEAILLDTSGRYAQSEQDADHKEWHTLLRLVRGARPDCPVNGLVVTVPVTSLLGRSPDALEESARQLRRNLNDITDELGVEAPIYVVVTKTDLVDGFVELASTLTPARLVELFGWTNAERRFADAGDAAQKGFTAVRDHLDAVLPELLLREGDAQRRRKLFTFPQEFDELSRTFAGFLSKAFAKSRYDETPFLRGVYFTSARREGETVPGVAARLGFAYARTPVDGRGPARGIFVRSLFRDMMLEDRELALPAQSAAPRSRRILLGVGLVFMLASALFWSIPFFGNYSAIRRLGSEAQSVLDGAGSPALDRLRQTIEAEEAERPRVFRRLGLGGSLGTAIDRARDTYLWTFGRDFEEPTKTELLRQAQLLDSGAFDALAELALDVSWLEARGTIAPEARPSLARFVKSKAGAVDPEMFATSYDAWLRWAPEDHVTRRLQQERDVFNRIAATLLDLERLERWSESNPEGHAPVRYTEVGLKSDSGTEVSGTYTRQTWDALVNKLIAAVERAGGATPTTVDAFRRNYVNRFDGSWRRYLMGTPLPPVSDPVVRSSPYVKLVDQIESQTRVELPRSGPEPSWLASLRNARSEQAAPDAKAGPPWPRYVAALDAVAADVETAESQPATALEIAQRVARRETSSFRSALDLVREMVPPGTDPQAAERLRQILSMPVLNGFSAVLESATGEIDRLWAERIGDRFGGELTEAQLRTLYAPRDGEIARFKSEVLDPFYADGRSKPVLEDRALVLGPAFEEWLRNAKGLGEALFGGGSQGMRITVRLEGVPSQVQGGSGMLVARRDLRLTCPDGVETFTYREGSGSHTFQWTPECQEVSLRVWAREGNGERELQPRREERGPLAFPTFLRDATEVSPGRIRFALEYPQEGITVMADYLLRSGESILAIAHTEPPSSVRN